MASKRLTIIIAAATSVCGVSAAIAVSAALPGGDPLLPYLKPVSGKR